VGVRLNSAWDDELARGVNDLFISGRDRSGFSDSLDGLARNPDVELSNSSWRHHLASLDERHV
jgi:hypothetical protein